MGAAASELRAAGSLSCRLRKQYDIGGVEAFRVWHKRIDPEKKWVERDIAQLKLEIGRNLL